MTRDNRGYIKNANDNLITNYAPFQFNLFLVLPMLNLSYGGCHLGFQIDTSTKKLYICIWNQELINFYVMAAILNFQSTHTHLNFTRDHPLINFPVVADILDQSTHKIK